MKSFADNEQRIENFSGRGYIQAGEALREVRNLRQFPQNTFEQYCEERWEMTRRNANRLVRAFELCAMLTDSMANEKTLWRDQIGLDLFSSMNKKVEFDISRDQIGPVVMQAIEMLSAHLPSNEGQAREVLLACGETLDNETFHAAKHLWKQVLESGEKITSALIAKIRDGSLPVEEDSESEYLLPKEVRGSLGTYKPPKRAGSYSGILHSIPFTLTKHIRAELAMMVVAIIAHARGKSTAEIADGVLMSQLGIKGYKKLRAMQKALLHHSIIEFESPQGAGISKYTIFDIEQVIAAHGWEQATPESTEPKQETQTANPPKGQQDDPYAHIPNYE